MTNSDEFIENIKQRLTGEESMDDVTIVPSSGGGRLAVIVDKNDEGIVSKVSILGCEICILPSMIEHLDNGRMLVSGRMALPASCIIEDDSFNPALEAMRLCPLCMRPITHEGRMREMWGVRADPDI